MNPFAPRPSLTPLVACLALWAGAARGLGGAAAAEDVAATTNQIASLAPEEAATLVAEFKGTELRLNGLTAISPGVANALAGFTGGALYLDGLSSLSADVAEVLAASGCKSLSLNGVTTLAPAEAAALATFRGHVLQLNGLTSLEPDVARALVAYRGTVDLNGLTTLADESAMALTHLQGQRLGLNGLTSLSTESARALAAFNGPVLFLMNLTTLSADAAEALAGYKGHVLFVPRMLEEIGNESPLNPGTARLVCACCSRSPPGNVIRLPSIEAIITPDAIEAAAILATATAPLDLSNLETISAECLATLMDKKTVKLPPVEELDVIHAGSGGGFNDDVVIP